MFLLVAILNELLQRENRVLHFWTLKKRRLDQCQQYVVFERSAKQVSWCVSETKRKFWIWFWPSGKWAAAAAADGHLFFCVMGRVSERELKE